MQIFRAKVLTRARIPLEETDIKHRFWIGQIKSCEIGLHRMDVREASYDNVAITYVETYEALRFARIPS